MALCRRTFQDEHFLVSDLELQRRGKSYTVDTMRELHERYPQDKLFLIIGSDMLLSFDRWYRYEEILSLCGLLVLSRDPAISPQKLRDYAQNTLHLTEGEGYSVLTLDPLAMSSTEIRARIAAGEDVSAFLTADTYDYIKEKGFYT